MLEVEVALEQPALARQRQRRGNVGGVLVAGAERDVPDLEQAAPERLGDELSGLRRRAAR